MFFNLINFFPSTTDLDLIPDPSAPALAPSPLASSAVLFALLHAQSISATKRRSSELVTSNEPSPLLAASNTQFFPLFSAGPGLHLSPSSIGAFDGQEMGSPYNTSVADYSEVLNPVGFKAISIVDNELAVKPRKGFCLRQLRLKQDADQMQATRIDFEVSLLRTLSFSAANDETVVRNRRSQNL
ncbi:putative thiol methyltransferase 2 [Platanthera guangdongensis]|uniref:Thiol methyltransferase 2 n=1 Tax=Platanthera guangdongensis TaxID=2320717 RepID=A0ABR2LG37_9ASPA